MGMPEGMCEIPCLRPFRHVHQHRATDQHHCRIGFLCAMQCVLAKCHRFQRKSLQADGFSLKRLMGLAVSIRYKRDLLKDIPDTKVYSH